MDAERWAQEVSGRLRGAQKEALEKIEDASVEPHSFDATVPCASGMSHQAVVKSVWDSVGLTDEERGLVAAMADENPYTADDAIGELDAITSEPEDACLEAEIVLLKMLRAIGHGAVVKRYLKLKKDYHGFYSM